MVLTFFLNISYLASCIVELFGETAKQEMKESVYVSQYLDSLQFEELSGVVKTDLFL